jgi:hypothetical protein
MPIHLLPSLNENSPNADQAGEWSAKDGEFLHTIATSLRKTRQGANVDDQTAVPDPWAQVMVFDAALFDDGHPLHPRAVGEWRGLLALFALAHQRSLNLSVEPISLRPPEARENGGARRSTAFGELVRMLRPHGTLTDEAPWDVIGAVRVKGRLAALLVPPTLVCPIRDGAPALDQVTWRNNDRLQDPCMAEGLNRVDYALILMFCRNMRENLKLGGHGANHRPTALFNLLERFIADLEPIAGLASGLGIERATPYSSLPPDPLYRPFMIQPRVVGQRDYHWGLPPRAEYAEFIKGALLIDLEMAQRVNVAAESIPIWRNISLDQIRRDPQLIATIREEAAEAGYLTLTPDDLFTPSLCRLSGSKVVGHPYDVNDDSRRHILPLQAAALLFLTPEQIRSGFRLSGDPAYGMDAVLSLSLTGDGRPCEALQIARTYGKARIVVREQPEALAAWPNFSSPSWRYNFLFCFFPDIKGVKVKPGAVSVAAVRDMLQGAKTSVQRAGILAELGQRFCEAGLTSIRAAGSEFMGIFHAQSTIEAVTWNETAPGLAGAGLILLPEAKEPPRSDAKWMIGVDFGTTNTMVYAKRDSEPPKPVTFANRLQSAFEAPRDKDLWRAFIDKFSLPDNEVQLPFMSVYKPVSGAGEGRRLPVCTDAIDFIPDPSIAITETIGWGLSQGGGQPPRNFNLKWLEDSRSRERMRLYLAQVVMQSLAEAMATGVAPSAVSCRFSYPEAFSITQRDEFSKILPGVLALGARPGGEPGDGPRLDTLRSESTCAGHFFYDREKAFFANSVLTLDIGGNTTDITLWQANRSIWGASLVLGGRHMVADFLVHNKLLLEQLLDGHKIRKEVDLFPAGGLHGDTLAACRNSVEMLLNTPLPSDGASGIRTIWHRYDNQTVTGQSLAQGLELIAEVALAGILYYVGNVIRVISAPNAEGIPLFDSQQRGLQICIGGKPSQLYKRLLPSRDDDHVGGAAKARGAGMAALMEQAAQIQQRPITFNFSDHPKHEVAYGLLTDTIARGDEKLLRIITGEELLGDGRRLSAQTDIEDLSLDHEWRADGLNELQRFIAVYQKEFGRRINLKPENIALLNDKVNQRLAEIQHGRKAEHNKGRQPAAPGVPPDARVMTMEPIFIIALRELIGTLIRNIGNNIIAKV